MQNLKGKTLAILIAAILTISMGASMTSRTLIPSVHAASTYTVAMYAYINVAPNPTGVGQQVEVIMWLEQIFGQNAELTNNYRFTNSFELVVTAPDGTNTSTTFPVVQSPTSDINYYYTPTTVGTYTLTFNFLGQNVTATNDPASTQIGDEYLPASASTTLTVQSTAIAAPPQTPLPTAFWTRPIYGENTAWYALGSNWLGTGSPGYIPNGGGPNLGGNGEEFGPTTNVGSLTAHIMWTLPLGPGGVVGQTNTGESTSATTLESIPGNTYSDGSAYDQKFDNPIIVDGLLIFTLPISQTNPSGGQTVCYNLASGQLLWAGAGAKTPNNPVPTISYAYVYDPEDPNQHGVWPPMLVSSGGLYFDAFTGDAMFNITGVPSGTTMLGPAGEYLSVYLHNYGNTTNPNWYLLEYNSSRLWLNLYSGASTTPTYPPPITNAATAVLENGINQAEVDDFNVSVPWLNTATGPVNNAPIGSVTQSAAIVNDLLLVRVGNYPASAAATGALFFGTTSSTPYEYIAVGLNATGAAYTLPGTPITSTSGSVNLGSELWSTVVQPPANNITVLWAGVDTTGKFFVEDYRETNQFVGYSLATGKEIWGPTAPETSLNYYGSDGSGSISDTIAYGNIYVSAYSGIVYCYSGATGDILWTYGNGGVGNSTNSGVETPFGVYPTFVGAVGNGVVYVITTEHTEEEPIFKGAVERAINATTGAEIWTLSCYTGEFLASSYAIADGYSVTDNGYNNEVYVVGQGASSTTVQAPMTAVTAGTNVAIQGTVMDISAGTQQFQQKQDFPNGVPCSSDASMTQWMQYVYDQQPEPTTFTGVTVTLTAIDPNGNFVTLGTATSDSSGLYHLTWTPPSIAGTYLVTATFAGNSGYYGSSAQTTMIVQNAPSATAAPTPAPASNTDTYVLGLGIAIIVVIIVVGAVLALLMLRKKP